MPRQSRIDAPGAIHHVIIRGIERRQIFRDDKDREAFLDRLGDTLLSTSTPCYAWDELDEPYRESGWLLYCRACGAEIGEPGSEGRKGSCYFGVRRLGITCATLADELNITPSGVSRAVERGHEIARESTIEERILKSQ